MTGRDHDRLVGSGLLGGDLSREARQTWPEWAREHVRECAACRASLVADLLGRPIAVPPAPSLAELRATPRSTPPITSLLDALPAFAGVYRAHEGALELERTPDGIRAWDRTASHLVVFGIARGAPPQVLANVLHSGSTRPGVSTEAVIRPAQRTRIVALATCGAIDVDLLRLWLSERFRDEWPSEAIPGADPRMHVAELELRPLGTARRLHVQVEPLPPSDETVTAWCQEAKAFGMRGRMAEAAMAYHRGLVRAHTLYDGTGQVKAGIGLALALQGLGFHADADALLADLGEHATFDGRWADLYCRTVAWSALSRGDVADAASWLAEAQSLVDTGSVWMTQLAANLAIARGAPEEALEALREPIDGVDENLARVRMRLRAFAHAKAGRTTTAVMLLGETPDPDAPLDLLLVDALARFAVGERLKGADQIGVAEARIADRTERLSSYNAHVVRALLAETWRANPRSAARLLEMRLLPPPYPEHAPLLLVVSSEREVFATDPTEPGKVRRIDMPRRELASLVRRAREEALTGSDPTCLSAVRALLLPNGVPREGLVVASDGVLADLPLHALCAVGQSPGHWLPTVVEVPAAHLPISSRPGNLRVATFADAAGDLPSADREIPADTADFAFRRQEVTRDALRTLPDVGLLHIGVHARREHGLPVLVFADGALSPVDFADMSFPSAPVVLLSGCATAMRGTTTGVERSLAEAFLRAGASAVVATRWPVEDREMAEVVRALHQLWPFRTAAEAVARVATDLRRRGLPMRIWAGLVAYQAGPDPEAGGEHEHPAGVARVQP